MKIVTTYGGPCIYARGVMEDGTETGRIQWTNQSKEELEQELLESLKTGRDDVRSFIQNI